MTALRNGQVLGQKKDKHIYIDTLRRYASSYQSEGTVKLPSIRRRKTRRHNKRTLDQRAKVMRDTDDGNKKDGGSFFSIYWLSLVYSTKSRLECF